jgi:hypothetical protein
MVRRTATYPHLSISMRTPLSAGRLIASKRRSAGTSMTGRPVPESYAIPARSEDTVADRLRPMRLHSYVVARDYGFAPNPFYGFCTLATCKPIIRRTAAIGDWVIGTGSKSRGREGQLVYVMRVDDILTYDDYWRDPRFLRKRPNFKGSKKQAFGDNIYHRDMASGSWKQENSHHSLADGRPNPRNIANDTQTPNVLVGDEYAYWGGDGPKIPTEFRNFGGYDLCQAGRGHKNNFPGDLVSAFVSWFRSLGEQGVIGKPLDWTRTP